MGRGGSSLAFWMTRNCCLYHSSWSDMWLFQCLYHPVLLLKWQLHSGTNEGDVGCLAELIRFAGEGPAGTLPIEGRKVEESDPHCTCWWRLPRTSHNIPKLRFVMDAFHASKPQNTIPQLQPKVSSQYAAQNINVAMLSI